MKKLAHLLFLASAPIALFSACSSSNTTAQNPVDTQLYSFSSNATPSADSTILGASDSTQTASQTSQLEMQMMKSTPSAVPSVPPTSMPQDTQPSQLQQVTQPKGPIVKTLKDFTPITAKEATITTSKGDITFTLFADKVPLTVMNFLTLAKSGFYNGVRFHRIIPNFMAQVGDPLTKDMSQQAAWGTGGPGYTIQDEFSPDLKHDSEGVVSMANTGQPNTGGSQFFITYEATPWLDGHHAVFGKVTKGMDVLKNLQIGDQITGVTFK